MTDHLSPEKRSTNMSRIRGKDTVPELTVRKLLHGLGFRFRLHRRDIPGNPDVILSKYRTVVFVHGCYWHRHEKCGRGRSVPSTNRDFWLAKFKKNTERDAEVASLLAAAGWRVLVVWECEIKPKKRAALEARLLRELAGSAMSLDPRNPA